MYENKLAAKIVLMSCLSVQAKENWTLMTILFVSGFNLVSAFMSRYDACMDLLLMFWKQEVNNQACLGKIM